VTGWSERLTLEVTPDVKFYATRRRRGRIKLLRLTYYSGLCCCFGSIFDDYLQEVEELRLLSFQFGREITNIFVVHYIYDLFYFNAISIKGITSFV